MKILLFGVFIISIILCQFTYAFSGILKNEGSVELVLINDTKYMCSLNMPSGYKVSEFNENDLNNEVVNVRAYTKSFSQEIYMFMATLYSLNTANMMNEGSHETLLNYAKERLKKIYGGKIVKEEQIEFNSCLGKELIIYSKDKDMFIRSINRIYWSSPFLYIISYCQLSKTPFHESIGNNIAKYSEKYFSSLKINNKCQKDNNKSREAGPIFLLISPEDFISFSDYMRKNKYSLIKIKEYINSALSDGVEYLTDEEKHETNDIYANAISYLSIGDQQKMASITIRLKKEEAISIQENADMDKMMSDMLLQLPKDRLKRLQYLNGKCLRTFMQLKKIE